MRIENEKDWIEIEFKQYAKENEFVIQGLIDEENCVDLNAQQGNKTISNSKVQELLKDNCSWSEMWLKFGQDRYPYDKNFMSISNYAIKNKIKNK